MYPIGQRVIVGNKHVGTIAGHCTYAGLVIRTELQSGYVVRLDRGAYLAGDGPTCFVSQIVAHADNVVALTEEDGQ